MYVGSHDGFNNVGVNYSRQVIYIKDDFWIVKDNFSSEKPHTYKQVWQGHYSLEEAPDLLHATFDDASGLDIYQIRKPDAVLSSGKHGKQWSVISKNNQTNYSFITLLYPYKNFANTITQKDTITCKGWDLNKSGWIITGSEPVSLTKKNKTAFFAVKELLFKDMEIQFSTISDVFVTIENGTLTLQSIGENDIDLIFINKSSRQNSTLKPGDIVAYTLD